MMHGLWSMFTFKQNCFFFFISFFSAYFVACFRLYFHFRSFFRLLAMPTWSEQTAVCKDMNRTPFDRLMIFQEIFEEIKRKKYVFSENATVKFGIEKNFVCHSRYTKSRQKCAFSLNDDDLAKDWLSRFSPISCWNIENKKKIKYETLVSTTLWKGRRKNWGKKYL